ncbi:hypothetical protein DBR06_SOUSAS8310034 [Sousa chinensis]|nr:hypothetical protein DBR06_SOUSAS8310034 [Sousa chinensis]
MSSYMEGCVRHSKNSMLTINISLRDTSTQVNLHRRQKVIRRKVFQQGYVLTVLSERSMAAVSMYLLKEPDNSVEKNHLSHVENTVKFGFSGSY